MDQSSEAKALVAATITYPSAAGTANRLSAVALLLDPAPGVVACVM